MNITCSDESWSGGEPLSPLADAMIARYCEEHGLTPDEVVAGSLAAVADAEVRFDRVAIF